ncbi:MAG TPA: 4,5-DOPA dioxygenase extradiol [Bacteroidia bacterium]|nr:4,5-DOPA dioxygenase extradiol [Bacteroidia bacterium]HRH07940.1 4,5-DOPA dioxygenase extradiol [Bacteroidia bacterium]HRH62506.1 4,5-DOPA dioxygenase extradiol [Bacteroidia bacterium]
MKRNEFIKAAIGLTAMTTLSGLKTATANLKEQDSEMPVLFVGHGSPMNAIEENEFSRGWQQVAASIPKPKAILCVSAHWETNGTFVTAMERPKTIHDFGGFPQALFDVQYKAPGSKWLAEETKKSILTVPVGLDESWGLDHGSWSVLKHLYPAADIPVIELSLDYTKDTLYHYNLAKELAGLRKKGVLIIGSGNMVHNFQFAKWGSGGLVETALDWAIEANEAFKKLISQNDFNSLINYRSYSKAFQLAAPSPDHYLPMIYALALRSKKDELSFFNDKVIGGSFSMTSFKLHAS